MAQYDIVLTQNVHASGLEYAERIVNVGKGGLLSALANGTPAVLGPGTDGYMLVRDDNEVTGLKWVAIEAGHSQNTDTGTTATSFQIDSDNGGGRVKSESTSKIGIRNSADDAYIDLQVSTLTAATGTFTNATVANAPANDTDVVNKLYVESLFSANDAMVFKGTMTSDGSISSKDGNVNGKTLAQLTDYSAGWTIKYGHATGLTITDVGTLERGDFLICIGDYDTAYAASDWKIIQGNIENAITDLSYTTAQSILASISANTPVIITAGENGVLRRNGAGDLEFGTINESNIANNAVALSKMAQVATGTVFYRTTAGTGNPEVNSLATLKADLGTMPIAWVSAPATSTSTGSAGQAAYDSNHIYVCTATNTWKRAIIATTW